MTRAEAAKKRKQFIADAEKKLYKITSAAERSLLDAVLNELFDTLGGDNILDDSGKTLKLTHAIEKIFDHFNKNKNLDIIREIAANTQTLTSLNQEYFAASSKARQKKFDAVMAEVDTTMKQRIGVGKDGQLVKGGYLHRLLYDTTLQNKVLELTNSANSNKWDTKEYLGQVRKVIVGDDQTEGGVSHHYRTFAHDTYSQYDRGVANGIALGLGLRAFIYEGGLIEDSREFCKKKNGRVFTREETEQWRNDPDLLVTKAEKNGAPLDYNPIEDMGRWSCRHMENWIDKDLAIKMRPDLKQYYANLEIKKS